MINATKAIMDQAGQVLEILQQGTLTHEDKVELTKFDWQALKIGVRLWESQKESERKLEQKEEDRGSIYDQYPEEFIKEGLV